MRTPNVRAIIREALFLVDGSGTCSALHVVSCMHYRGMSNFTVNINRKKRYDIFGPDKDMMLLPTVATGITALVGSRSMGLRR